MSNDVDLAVRRLWDFLDGFGQSGLSQNLSPNDTAAILFGCTNIQVAHEAARFLQNYCAIPVVCSGGHGRLSAPRQSTTEARRFADYLIGAGLSNNQILLEEESSNTAENVRNSWATLPSQPRNLLLFCNNIYRARVRATVAKQLPDCDIYLFSPSCNLAEFTRYYSGKSQVIELMTGEIDRLIRYPQIGYCVPIDVPTEIISASDFLKRLGYDRYSI
jgi:hypothetical protein